MEHGSSSASTAPDAQPAPAASIYRGRFAPSPTGPLHLGSLVAAVGSYLDAKHHAGRWLVRIEDIDPPRTVAGAADSILRTLEAHGLRWDEPPRYQLASTSAHQRALRQLRTAGDTFYCSCSRSQLNVPIYGGTCRDRNLPALNNAERLRVPSGYVHCEDLLYGEIGEDVAQAVGDFVLKRRDGPYAYQLAVVVDDAEAGINHVVRGFDLLDNSPRQVLLQRLLGHPTPRYLHLPLVLDSHGKKLSKQTHAPALSGRPQDNLFTALQLLGQAPEPDLSQNSCEEMLQHAAWSWQRGAIPRMLRGHPD